MRHISLDKQLELLRHEYEYEKKAYEQDAQTGGIKRRIRHGDCWPSINIVKSYYNSLDRLVVEVSRSIDMGEDHNFEYGKTVRFFTEDGSGNIRFLNFNAQVNYAEEDSMVIILPDESCLTQLHAAERLGVQLFFDERTYTLMFDALRRVIAAKDGRLHYLKDLFHGNTPLAEPTKTYPIRLPWLNPQQELAVNRVIACKDVAIVHGPPGTGKTTTLIESISEVLRREPQVMVCAQSNTAVDWISEQLADRGFNVLRIGNPTRVTDKMLSHTYERQFENHPDYPTLWSIRRNIKQLYSSSRQKRTENFHQKVSRLKDKADEIELRIRHELFDRNRIISCTLTGSANPLLHGQHFHTLFIDEAAQAMEAACWIAIQKADRVILAGDHQQLPPTIKSPYAQREGLGRTLMEQIVEHKPKCVTLLTMQYRMNETLMQFSSNWFYDGKLEAAPSVKHRSMTAELDKPLLWVNSDNTVSEDDGDTHIDYTELTSANNHGRINKAEALLTLQTLKNYTLEIGIKRIIDERIDIGIISPYRAQVQYLRRIIYGDPDLKRIRRHMTINTVDSFQGQERDVMIISLVRSNEQGQIGFLSDLRRMNVAMTRARMKLIIIGSAATLCKHKFYRALYKHCKEQGKVTE